MRSAILTLLFSVLLMNSPLFSQEAVSPEEFVTQLSTAVVPTGKIMVFFVEQNSFAIKTDRQKIIWTDPFLSRKNLDPAMFIHKAERIDPAKAPADYVFCTHAHLDHTHLETIEAMNGANPGAVFIGPKESGEIFAKAGVPEERMRIVKLNDEVTFPGISAKAVYAQHTGSANDVTHLGYLIDCGGIKVYDSGDTKVGLDDYIDKMGVIRDAAPDVAIIAINKGYKNPGPEDAVKLASHIQCGLFIPAHYNCFVDNSIDPKTVFEYIPRNSGMKCVIMDAVSYMVYPE